MRENQNRDQEKSENRTRQEALAMPPCCGTGCAVCVLDYWTDDELEPVRQEECPEHNPEKLTESLTAVMSESDMLAMLEAIEKAQWQFQLGITQIDGE